MLLLLLVLFILSLPFLYDTIPSVRYYSKFYFYYGYVMIAAVFLIPTMSFRPKSVDNLLIASRVCKLISRVLGLRWTIRGRDKLEIEGPCVFVANHQSSLDILGMFEAWEMMGQVTVVAKRELFFAWPFGLAAWLCGLIFIDRTNSDKAKAAINEAVLQELIPNKIKLWVFPEGTRNNTGTIHFFKKGAFHVAISAQLPVVPVVFSQYHYLDSKSKVLLPGDVIMTALPPIETKGLTISDVEDLMEKTRTVMLDVFNHCEPDPFVIQAH